MMIKVDLGFPLKAEIMAANVEANVASEGRVWIRRLWQTQHRWRTTRRRVAVGHNAFNDQCLLRCIKQLKGDAGEDSVFMTYSISNQKLFIFFKLPKPNSNSAKVFFFFLQNLVFYRYPFNNSKDFLVARRHAF